MDGTSGPWGVGFIHLQFPMFLVMIDGLSKEQERSVAADYASFVVNWSKELQRVDVICHARRLEQPLEALPERFTANEQYTPCKHRLGRDIEITGFNSLGQFVRGGPVPIQSSLAVNKQNEFSQAFVLENFLRILMAYHVLDQGGVLLHSAGVLYQDRVYLFCGRSNAGKTTLARKAAEAGARVLSDDINLLTPGNGGYRAHKVPFTGEFGRQTENLSGCGSFPIGGLVLLEKTPKLTAAPVRPAEAMAGLLTGCPFVNDDPDEFPALMDILSKLVFHMPVIRLGVARDDPFEAIMTNLLEVL